METSLFLRNKKNIRSGNLRNFCYCRPGKTLGTVFVMFYLFDVCMINVLLGWTGVPESRVVNGT